MSRRLLGAMVLVCAVVGSPDLHAQEPSFMLYGPHNLSCGTFTTAKPADRNALEWWVLGFVSAINYSKAPTTALVDTDTSGMIAWVTKYCADNPLDRFPNAAIRLVLELKLQRLEQTQATAIEQQRLRREVRR